MASVTHPAADSSSAVEAEVRALGRRLARRHGSPARRVARAAEDRSVALLARDPHVMAALFRLVDVAPACDGPEDLARHLAGLLAEAGGADAPSAGAHARGTPGARAFARVGAHAADTHASQAVAGRIAAAAVASMARRFIAGADPRAATPELARLWRGGTASSVDLLGEATVTPAEGRRYARRCENALDTLSAAARDWPARPRLEQDALGVVPRVNLSVKVTALTPLVRAAAPERGRADAAIPLRALLRRARGVGAHLHVDMESLDSRELVLDLVLDLLSEPEFRTGPSAGIVLQGYLRDAEDTLARVLDWARVTDRTPPLVVRLVKGAYWDHETIEAAQHGWAQPVWGEKAESDRCFERMTRALVDAFGLVRPAIATHNVRSAAHAIVRARRAGLADGDVELQVLRGLGDDLQDAIAAEGLRGRTYCPVGDLVAGMAYLVRRLLENASNDSFLASRASGVDLDRLLAAP